MSRIILYLLPGGGGKRGTLLPLLVIDPVPEDPKSDELPDLPLLPGIEIEKVCPSFRE